MSTRAELFWDSTAGQPHPPQALTYTPTEKEHPPTAEAYTMTPQPALATARRMAESVDNLPSDLALIASFSTPLAGQGPPPEPNIYTDGSALRPGSPMARGGAAAWAPMHEGEPDTTPSWEPPN